MFCSGYITRLKISSIKIFRRNKFEHKNRDIQLIHKVFFTVPDISVKENSLLQSENSKNYN